MDPVIYISGPGFTSNSTPEDIAAIGETNRNRRVDFSARSSIKRRESGICGLQSSTLVWLALSSALLLIIMGLSLSLLVRNRGSFPNENTGPGTKLGFPSSLRFTSVAHAAFSKVNASRIESFINHFSSFPNRNYNNGYGVAAAEWLMDQVNAAIIDNPNYKGTVTVKPFKHLGFLQPSTIARIQGSEPGVVILGAHMDSLQPHDRSGLVLAPGADDNASGSAAILETFRAIIESGFVSKKSIEFHWYAGEEMGLLGSKDIASHYDYNDVEVISMLNLDGVGYKSNSTPFSINFITDYTNADLNRFLGLAVEGYLHTGHTNQKCGYRCSDHASWNTYGFPSAFAREPEKSPYYHTTKDSRDTIDFEMVKQFALVAVSYLVEIAEPRG